MRRFLGAVLAAGVLLITAASPATAGAAPAWCPKSAACSTVSVPLDWAGRVPGTITLPVARRAATGASRGAVAVLVGGPGQAALPLFDDLATTLEPLLRDHDLVVFDARGTGSAGALRCRSEDVAACAGELGPGRAFYTTREAVRDIDAVRAALGLDRLSLYAVSYGTRVARAYALAFPGRTDRLVLDSAVPAEGPDPFNRSTIAAIPRVLREVCKGGLCRNVTPAPERDYARLVARLHRAPLGGWLVDGHGRRERVRVTEADLLNLLFASDLDPALRDELPAALRSAAKGDPALLVRLLGSPDAQYEEVPEEMSSALFLATTCEEAPLPWLRTAAPAQRLQSIVGALNAIGAAVFAPFGGSSIVENSILGDCAQWPAAAVAPQVDTGPLSGVPTLILSGREDLRTPLEDAQRISTGIAGSIVVPVADSGHSVLGSSLSECPLDQVVRFFAGRATAGCEDRLGVPVDELPPGSLAATPVYPKTHGLRGRVIGAVGQTVADGVVQGVGGILMGAEGAQNLPGLRAGSYRFTDTSLTVRRAVYIPGVVVSGKLNETRSHVLAGLLHVSARGQRSLSGTVRVDRHGGLRARLGRVTVTVTPRAHAAGATDGFRSLPRVRLPLRLR